MSARLRAAVGMIVGLLAVACLAAGPAGASHGTNFYCLNGQTASLPNLVWYEGGGARLTDATAHAIVDFSGGRFQAGFAPAFNRTFLTVPAPGDPPPDSFFAPGYSTNFISLGACAPPPPDAQVGVCKVLPRADGTTGAFQSISVRVWNDSKGQYFDAPAANWVEGLGLTCDNPLALGYKAAGYSVSWGATRASNHDAKGVRGSGFNDIYPYFTK